MSEASAVHHDTERGLVWELTGTDGLLTSVKVTGKNLGQLDLRSFGTDAMRKALWPAGLIHGRTSDLSWRRAKPTNEEFAEVWKDTAYRAKREILAARYDVSTETIDKMTRRARDAGLLPPAVTGRKRYKVAS